MKIKIRNKLPCVLEIMSFFFNSLLFFFKYFFELKISFGICVFSKKKLTMNQSKFLFEDFAPQKNWEKMIIGNQ